MVQFILVIVTVLNGGKHELAGATCALYGAWSHFHKGIKMSHIFS